VLLNLSVADPDAKRLIGCLLTQQAEAVAKSRGRLTQEQKSKRYVIIIDEVQNYVYQSGLALENMFAEARKANVSVWVAHQYGAQLPEELHGALSECDIIVVFKVGHKDALISAEQLEFPIDPHRVKQETGNPFSEAGTRKTFYTPEEHRVMQAGWIQSLQPRIAYISLPDGRLDLMRTLEVPQHTNEQRLQEIEQEYLRRYFRSKAEIDREIEDTLADFASSQNTEQNAQLQETSSRASAQTPNAVIGLEELPINNDKEPRAKDLPALPTTSAQTDKKPESMQSPRLKRQVKRKDDFDVF